MLEVGIHRITMAQYLADPCPVPSLSSGVAHRLVAESPMHAYYSHPRLGGKISDPNAASDMGTIVHDLLLGGEGKFCIIDPSEYRSKPTKDNPDGSIPVGWTNTAIREARDQARGNGLVPMLAGDMVGARRMADAARAFVSTSRVKGVFDHGESELTVIGKLGDVFLRTRPDWLNDTMGISLSFKTTKTLVRPEKFEMLARSMGYGFQTMFYQRALIEAHLGMATTRHIILAQEQSAPYACALFELSPALATIEQSQVSRAIGLWHRCMTSKDWPAYGPEIHRLEPKPWDLAAEEARLVEDELEAMDA